MPNDVNGIYQYTEGEAVPSLFSVFLNKLGGSVSVAIASINTILTNNIADTGWQNLALLSGATVADALTPRIRRKNGVVYIQGRMLQGSTLGFSVPAGYFPAQSLRLAAMSGATGSAAIVLVIDRSTSQGYTTAGATINLAHSWPVD